MNQNIIWVQEVMQILLDSLELLDGFENDLKTNLNQNQRKKNQKKSQRKKNQNLLHQRILKVENLKR